MLYVFRTLVDDDIPMNAGCLKPLDIVIPEGSMLAPRYPAAVVAGNVETSQAITDTLYGALGVLAASQGTMNNFTFGNATYQYYETISGGSGAGPDFDGASVVQTHMTNSRLTDPEVLEWRFPVRLESYAIRRGSGGAGRHRGGDGGVRRMRFLEPMTAVMLANHRRVAPFGVAGGSPGAVGRNWVERADRKDAGAREEYGATFEVEMNAGDVFVVETPGGRRIRTAAGPGSRRGPVRTASGCPAAGRGIICIPSNRRRPPWRASTISPSRTSAARTSSSTRTRASRCSSSTRRANADSRRSTRASKRCTRSSTARGSRSWASRATSSAAQEPGSEKEIAKFCEVNYGVTFPMFAKVDVNGDEAAPLYRYLKKAKPGLLGSEAIKWNFTKFLVDRKGNVVERYPPNAEPASLEGDIEKLL